ncbi:MAG: tRNA pseudouridine(38-40) synthase TruA [Deltaproteobacteria bacterium]|nr:tRNA pseudouridine(38-40) synthase TruA [Deltaproteobacteria bacterium]
MRNIKLIIEYDGTAYCGWQIQPNGVTVQALIQNAVSKMTGKKAVLLGASRTDAGVHAIAQAANFKTESKISCEGFRRGLNSLLPNDIVIKNAEDVPISFHAKNNAKGKHYRYLILLAKSRPAILKNRAWHLRKNQNINAVFMQKAAKALVGKHNFTSFCASGDANCTKVRQIDAIKVKTVKFSLIPALDSTLIAIDVFGGGFLKFMVRNIVGTLVSVLSAGEMKKILEAKDRKKAGVTAPACGLYLVSVKY